MNGTLQYTIRPYDTIWMLAQIFNTTVDSIMDLNPGIDPRNLFVGQVITIRPGYRYYQSSQVTPGNTDEIGDIVFPGNMGNGGTAATPGQTRSSTGAGTSGSMGGTGNMSGNAGTVAPGQTRSSTGAGTPGSMGGTGNMGSGAGTVAPGQTRSSTGAGMPGNMGGTGNMGSGTGTVAPGQTRSGTGAGMPGNMGGTGNNGSMGGTGSMNNGTNMNNTGNMNGDRNWGYMWNTGFMDYMNNGMNGMYEMEDMDMVLEQLPEYLRMLWEQHVKWTRMAEMGLVHDLPETDLIVQRLLQNPGDFASALAPFYGEEAADEFEQLLTAHLTIASELIKAAKAGDNTAVADANRRWHDNAEQIASFLGSINPYWNEDDWSAMLNEHLDLLSNDVSMMLAGNYEGSINNFDDVEMQALEMADVMAEGIQSQFSEMR